MKRRVTAALICEHEPERVVAIEADGNYSTVVTIDGERHFSGYCKKQLIRRFGLNLKKVNRKVSVDANRAKLSGTGVSVAGNFYKFSRRKRKNWLTGLIILFSFVVSFAQNLAPIAVNDTLKVCNDITTPFNVLANDYDPDGDRLVLTAFNNPSNIDIVARGNTGMFRLDAIGNVGTFQFSYTVKDLRFANIGSMTATANVFISASSPYTYSGVYTTTNARTACRSSTSGTVTINNGARETMVVDTYGELLPGTTIAPNGSGVFELTVKQ